MKVKFSKPNENDYKKFTDAHLCASSCLEGRIKITVKDDDGNTAELFVKKEELDRLGEDYICSHITMQYSSYFREWFAKLSQNDYYNDTERNPEKVIVVKFEGIEGGTGREVYKGIENERYYLRENHFPRKNFAKWLICGKYRKTDDGYEPRANLIFECNGQREKVRFDDWNGVAAYKDTFNKDFSASANKE